jgi:hypothetical protein
MVRMVSIPRLPVCDELYVFLALFEKPGWRRIVGPSLWRWICLNPPLYHRVPFILCTRGSCNEARLIPDYFCHLMSKLGMVRYRAEHLNVQRVDREEYA